MPPLVRHDATFNIESNLSERSGAARPSEETHQNRWSFGVDGSLLKTEPWDLIVLVGSKHIRQEEPRVSDVNSHCDGRGSPGRRAGLLDSEPLLH